jgi:prepilin-type N-terminal cleavage/methylation domain-containing protein
MRKRQGFTLVELLVAMALIIFIMSILSYAFVAATTTFRDLKAAGDMAEKLRSATTLLQRDLSLDHFDGRRRMSDPTFWLNGPPRQGFFRLWQGTQSTFEGKDLDGIPVYRSTNHALHFTVHLRGNRLSDYFSARVPDKNSAFVAPDWRSPSPLPGAQTMGPMAARYEDQDPNQGTFNSQWAEVVYFLRAAVDVNGNQETANGTPLYTLYRRQLLLVNDNNLVQYSTGAQAQLTYHAPLPLPVQWQPTPYLDVSCWQGYPELTPWSPLYNPTTLYFNSPMDVTVPQRRFGMNMRQIANNVFHVYPESPTPAPAGTEGIYPVLAEQTTDTSVKNADVLLTDVVSFDVRVLLQTNANTQTANTDPSVPPPFQLNDYDPFVDLFHPSVQVFNNGNPLYLPPLPPPLPLTSWWPPPAVGSPLYNVKYIPPTTPQVFDTWTSVRDPLATVFNPPGAPPTPLTVFGPFYDYSSWGQAGSLVSIPLWANGTGPRIMAIQIQLRVWDNKTQQTRQVTLVQAM